MFFEPKSLMLVAGMNVSMVQFFVGGGAQAGNFHGEMQLLACQGMVEIQMHGGLTDLVDTGDHGLVGLIMQFNLYADFHGDVLRELVTRHIHKGLAVPFTVPVTGSNNYILALSDCHAVQGLFQAGDDIALAL